MFNLSIVSELKYWYANFSVRVKWNGTVGEYIPVKKGVRQGAVLSPSIFKCVLASTVNFFTMIILALVTLHMLMMFCFLAGQNIV